MSDIKRKGEIVRNYSDETFYSDSSEEVQPKCKSAATLLQKRRHIGPINGCSNPYRNATRIITIAASTRNNVSSVAQKIMSAKLLRVKQLQNELMDTQFQLNELSSENRLLRTLQRRQDMALKKYEGTQAELPQLIRSHNEEVRALKTKLKQAKAQNRDLEERLKTRESELEVLRDQHRRLLKLSKDKRLGEREQLQLQLEHMQDLLKEQDKKVQMLTRKVMLEGKNFKHQLATEIARHKTTAKELDAARDRITQLETLLESKEKLIAANMPRIHPHHSVSLVSLGPPARFRLNQSRGRSPNGRNSAHNPPEERACIRRENAAGQRRGGVEGEEEEEDGDNNDDDDDDDDDDIKNNEYNGISGNDDVRKMLPLCQVQTRNDQQKIEVLQSKKEYVRIQEIEVNSPDKNEETNVDDSEQEELKSTIVCTGSNTYLSKVSTNVSVETIQRENKDSRKDEVRKSQSMNKVSSFQCEMEQLLDMRERRSSRRCAVGGDSTLVPDEQNSSARRGSFNGAGDNEKKEKGSAFLSSLVSEIDRENFMRRNVLIGKRVPERVNKREVEQSAGSRQSEENYEKSEQMLPELAVEEGRHQFKTLNKSWEDLSSRLREETSKAKSIIEEGDEIKDTTFKLPSATEPYNKRNLLAALKAIDNGADPVNLKDEKTGRKNCFSSSKETLEILHKGVSAQESLSAGQPEAPKTKADLMQELFGSQKADASTFCIDAVRNFPDSHLRSRLNPK